MKSPSIPTEYMVRVECMTYNHAAYIEDAMNGFCMQETDFPFVCVIVDDASTDGEPEVIRNYLEQHFDLTDTHYARTEETNDYVLSFARHNTNHNCFFGVLFLKYNHYRKKGKNPYFEEWSQAKYIALCEGDDYWTDKRKLQEQVNALNRHSECSFCSTGSLIRRIDDTYLDRTIKEDNTAIYIFGIEAWERKPISKTFTLLIRREALKAALSSVRNYKNTIDMHLSYHLIKLGKCAYIPKPMAMYRITGEGAWTSLSWAQQKKWQYSIYRELYIKNNKDKDIYDLYFNSIVEIVQKVGVNDFQLVKEAIGAARNLKDWNLALSMALHFIISKLRANIAFRTRLRKLIAS